MRSDPAVDERRRRRLAEIVADGAEHHGDLLRDSRGRRSACAPRRSPAACGPRRPLRDATPVPAGSRRARRARETAARRPPSSSASAKPIDGRARAQQQLLDLSPDPLGRAGRRAGCVRHSAVVPGSTANSKRAANWTARSTRRLSSRERPGIDGAEQCAARGRRRPSNGSRYSLGQRIPGDGVDREVAAARRLLERQRRIALDGESLVAAAGLRLAPGQRHVEAGDLVDGEALADGVDAAEAREQRLQAIRRRRRRPRRRCLCDGRPISRSRTQPPTISARPPSSRTARAIADRACSSRRGGRHRLLARCESHSRCSGTTGSILLRAAQRLIVTAWRHDPPRDARRTPDAGPARIHAQATPRSSRDRASRRTTRGCWRRCRRARTRSARRASPATAPAAVRGRLRESTPESRRPMGNAAPSTPPRAARSHSASVGSRSALPVRRAPRAIGRRVVPADADDRADRRRQRPGRSSRAARRAPWPSMKRAYSPRVTG